MEGSAIYFRKNNLSPPSNVVSYVYSQNIHSFNNNSIIVFSPFIFIPTYPTGSLRNTDLHTQVCALLKTPALLFLCLSTCSFTYFIPCMIQRFKIITLALYEVLFFFKVCLFKLPLKSTSTKHSQIILKHIISPI